MKEGKRKRALKLDTYGNINPIIKVYQEIKNRFKPNKYSMAILNHHGLKSYVPKINGLKLGLGLLVGLICVVVPFITPLAYYPLKWGLK